MQYYRNKRIKSGLSKSDIAKELELDYERYDAIERGDLKMPTKLLDRFNSIINRGIENKIISEDNSRKADEFWNEVSQRTGDKRGQYVLSNKIKEFNINSLRELSGLLGYRGNSIMATYLTGTREPSGEFKKRLYNFFADENNIQLPTKRKVRRKKYETKPQGMSTIKELDSFYKKTNFKEELKRNNITLRDFSTALNIDRGYVSNIFNRRYKPSYPLLQKIKEYFDSLNTISNVETPTVETPHVEIPKIPDMEIIKTPDFPELTAYMGTSNTEETEVETTPSVISRYASELNDITELMREYQTKINDLEIRRKICIEVLDAISEYTGGEKQCSHN